MFQLLVWKSHEWMDVSATCMENAGNWFSFMSFMAIWNKNLLIPVTNEYGNAFWLNRLYVTLMDQNRNGMNEINLWAPNTN